MGPKIKGKVTRQISSEKLYGGGPQDLPENVIPTYRDIARYHHFIVETKSVGTGKDSLMNTAKMILEKLKLVWTKVSDKMPLLSDKAKLEKIKRFIVKVRGVPNRSITSNSKKDMDEKCDTIFDISSCRCELKTAECSDRDVRCKEKECNKVHIVCICDRKVQRFIQFKIRGGGRGRRD